LFWGCWRGAEGLLAAQRPEQVGRLPTRTVYSITEAGHRELARVCRAVLLNSQLRPEPFDLALALSDQAPGQDLSELVGHRKDSIRAQMDAVGRLKGKARPHLSAAEREVSSQSLHSYQAELNWHDELLERMALTSDGAGTGTPGGPDPTRPPASLRRQPWTPPQGGHSGTGESSPVGSALPAPAAAADQEQWR